MRLDELKVGQSATVTKVNGEGALRRRVMDLGVTKGVVVTVRKTAPLGDPMELILRGYSLTVRKDDATIVEVEL
ncbi:MAG: FeoA domain-containing protein [Christensenellaceae bacterium]|nr:FeoA domain-containing protein [Christensenellaceae bacterium]